LGRAYRIPRETGLLIPIWETRLPSKWVHGVVPRLDLAKATGKFGDEEPSPCIDVFLTTVSKPDVIALAVGLVARLELFQIPSTEFFTGVKKGMTFWRPR